jgi:hypothetical protein
MTSAPSPEGRRILVAVVTGHAGEQIQRWREQYDPEQAKRLPPHATLCYWAPVADVENLEEQVRHAFPVPFDVRLGPVRLGTNDQQTMYVEVVDRSPLDEALVRLYDGTHVEMPVRRGDWLWHVTCVRESRGRDQAALMAQRMTCVSRRRGASIPSRTWSSRAMRTCAWRDGTSTRALRCDRLTGLEAGLRAEGLRDERESVAPQGVVNPCAAALTSNESRLEQDLEVMTDCGLR